jgi:hypothetical protein
MSKSSFIIVPVSNDGVKSNMEMTVDFTRGIGYWCTPAGTNGDNSQVGDQVWFVGGKTNRTRMPTV